MNLFAAVAAGAVLSLGIAAGAVFYFRRRRKQVELLDFHVRQAEKAYARMYDARNDAEAAAAYSDLQNDFAVALALAANLGMKKRAGEIERRLEQCRAVYRSQFSR